MKETCSGHSGIIYSREIIFFSKVTFHQTVEHLSLQHLPTPNILHTSPELSHSLPLPPSVPPSVCSCVTESVTPQQEVKEGELEAGRERWQEGDGAKVEHRITLDI